MSHVKDKPKRRAADRRPDEVPHHPKVLTLGMLATVVALVLMVAWFWSVSTGPGLILTAEQQRAAEIAAREEAEANSAAEQDKTQADLDREAEARSGKGKKSGSGQGAPPEAPAVNVTATDGLELTTYSILSVNGLLNVGGQLENNSAEAKSGTVRAHVYVDGLPIATAQTEVERLRPGRSTKVNMVSESDYQAGQKVILLEFDPQ